MYRARYNFFKMGGGERFSSVHWKIKGFYETDSHTIIKEQSSSLIFFLYSEIYCKLNNSTFAVCGSQVNSQSCFFC